MKRKPRVFKNWKCENSCLRTVKYDGHYEKGGSMPLASDLVKTLLPSSKAENSLWNSLKESTVWQPLLKKALKNIWLQVLNNLRDLLIKLFYKYVYLWVLKKNVYKVSYVTLNNTLQSWYTNEVPPFGIKTQLTVEPLVLFPHFCSFLPGKHVDYTKM